jgi:hypothetical protein
VAWKNARYGAKNRSSANNRSTAASSTGTPKHASGTIDSHKLAWSPTVRSIDGLDPYYFRSK